MLYPTEFDSGLLLQALMFSPTDLQLGVTQGNFDSLVHDSRVTVPF